MRRALTVLLALLLAGCGMKDARAPFLDSQAPPGLAPRFYPPEGWAWGLAQPKRQPPQRYGVASPPVVPRAEVLILPGLGESAEVWFETARELVSRGATVWILEGAGQAGSARFGGQREIAHTPGYEPDVAGLIAVRDEVMRGGSGAPVFILASGDAAPVVLVAISRGLRAEGLILTSPHLTTGVIMSPLRAAEVRFGLGGLPAPGAQRWRRDGLDGVKLRLTHDAWRGGINGAWQLANPDLRFAGPSLGWRAGRLAASRAALRGANGIKVQVLVLAPNSDSKTARELCSRLGRCDLRLFGDAEPALHLEADRYRAAWLDAITARVFSAKGEAARPAKIDLSEPKMSR